MHAQPWLDSLATGLAVTDAEGWAIHYVNAAFERWFPGQGSPDTLATRIARLDPERARRRLAERGSYALEVESGEGAGAALVGLVLRVGADGRILVEAQDETRRKRSEYMLDSYARMMEKNARELEKEKTRVERLLLNMMPRSVLKEMREFGTVSPQRFEQASVMMLDFVDFTRMTVEREPSQLVAELNDIFTTFDLLAEMFECERIKTNGDSYMAVCGVPEPNLDHVSNVARMALRMRRYLAHRNRSNPHVWQCRIGIATGPLVSSLIGSRKYVYDVFGPAVNLAARLEALSAPMQILVCAETAGALPPDLAIEPLADAEAKGFGRVTLHALLGERRDRDGAEPVLRAPVAA